MSKKIANANKRHHLLALVIGVSISILVGYNIYKTNLEKQELRFNTEANNLLHSINSKMDTYRAVLYSGVGFFEASDNVTREKWCTFVEKIQIKEHFPGIQGVGYAVALKEHELQKNIQEIRAEGFESYNVFPEGKRDIYTSIVYLEPFDARNKRAFGYDMYSEEIRREAMSRAIETSLPSLSSKVKLVQEDGEEEQNGFLLYAPLYKKGMPLETKQERYDAIAGFVYAPFRAKDFLFGIIDSSLKNLDVKMYDGDVQNADTLLFESNAKANLNNAFRKVATLEVDGQKWSFDIRAKGPLFNTSENAFALIIASLGVLISFLIAYILKRQSEIAVLRDDALSNVSQGVLVTDANVKIIYANRGFEDLTGYGAEEIYGEKPSFLQGERTSAKRMEYIKQSIQSKKPFECQILNYKKDGTPFWNLLSVTPVFDADKRVKHFIGIQNDITERKNLEQTMLFEKNVLENILDNTSAIIALLDMNGVMLRLNEYGKRFVGHTQEEISSEAYFWKKFIPEQIRAGVENVFTEIKKGNLVEKHQSPWFSSDGAERVFEWSNKLIKDSDGNPEYLITVGIDITQEALAREQQKKIQLQYISSEAKFRGLFELSPIGISMNDYNTGEFLEFNAAVNEPAGYTPEEFKQLSYFELTPKEYMEDEKRQIELMEKTGYYGPYEKRYIRKDGTSYPVLLNGFKTRTPEGRDVIWSIVQDVTEQKSKENALLQAQEKSKELLYEQNSLLSLFDKGDSVLFKWRNNPSWSIAYVSNSAQKLLGYGIEEFTSSEVVYASCIHEDDIARVMSEVKESVEKNKDFFIHQPYRVLTKENQTKWVLDYTVAQKDEDGNILYFIGYIIDISEQKELEQTLLDAKEQAERANKAKGEFLANMSHEIRTPLNAILGFVDILREKTTEPESKKYLETIDSSSQHLLGVINDILDFSKLESGKLSVESIDFDVQKELSTIYQLFSAKVSEKNIDLVMDIDSSLPRVLVADPLRLKQVISNLLSNAIKFTQNDKKIYLTFSYSDEMLRASIQDEGIGIAKEKQQKIFEAFSQADNSTTREYGGTGLGLAISSELVRLMGGELKLKSELGEGSEFYFSIPAAAGKLEAPNETQKAYASFKGRKVLLVEDNKANQMFMKILLQKLELEFDVANDGLEAVEMFKNSSYDLILMDENMPNMNGIKATREILAIEQERARKHTPIIALTANALKGDREKFLEAGMDEYLTKPVDRQKLQDAMRRFFGDANES